VILVDTSIWVDYLRSGNEALGALLGAGLVLVHPFVAGELALGVWPERNVVLRTLADLPRSEVATNGEVLGFIERHGLYGRGVGYVDVHLWAAAQLIAACELWTGDRRLYRVARSLDLAWGE